MKSHTTRRFRALLAGLPESVQNKAKSAYARWADNPGHPSLRFKKVHDAMPIYSVRIDRAWRALGVLDQDSMIGFWIGSHGDYEAVLRTI